MESEYRLKTYASWTHNDVSLGKTSIKKSSQSVMPNRDMNRTAPIDDVDICRSFKFSLRMACSDARNQSRVKQLHGAKTQQDCKT